jgi:hypothetical protein
MSVTGTIRPAWGAKGFSREAWSLFKRRPELLPYQENMANVVVDGRPAGKVCWSMADALIIVVLAHPSARAMVLQWAEVLDGYFTEESW